MAGPGEHTGAVIAGRFALERVAGHGGMSTVYQARDWALGERVALKLVSQGTPGAARRFDREVAVLSRLGGVEGVARYLDHGAVGQDTLYLAMEWLDGTPLNRVLRARRLTPRQAVTVVCSAARVLGEVHVHGFVHRDVKPGNLMVQGDVERVKLLDFGVAKALEPGAQPAPSGSLVGTPAYMAPEQASQPAGADPRADVFSLGCVLYQCLVGERPFQGADPAATLDAMLHRVPPRARRGNPRVPPDLDELVARMMARDPAERPDSGHEVANLLAPEVLGDEPW